VEQYVGMSEGASAVVVSLSSPKKSELIKDEPTDEVVLDWGGKTERVGSSFGSFIM
jgi:hypothetical protein